MDSATVNINEQEPPMETFLLHAQAWVDQFSALRGCSTAVFTVAIQSYQQ